MSDIGMTPVATSRRQAAHSRAAARYPHDVAVTAVILGVAALAWFSWGQAAPPAGWAIPLRVGAVLSLIIAIAAVVTARRSSAAGSAMSEAAVRRRYLIIVATEVAFIVAGAAVLGAASRSAYLPAWILLVVGAHFIPLARLFSGTGLIPAGVLLVLIAIAAAITGVSTTVAPSAIAGAGGGLVCGARAAICLIRARSQAVAIAGRRDA
jgi:hypothetical protein